MQTRSHKTTSVTRRVLCARSSSFVRPAKHETTRLKSAGDYRSTCKVQEIAQLLESAEAFEKEDRTSKDSPKVSQRNVVAEQCYQLTPTMQNPYHESLSAGSRYTIRAIRFNRQCRNKCGYHQCKRTWALTLSRCSGPIILEEVLLKLHERPICRTL
jgi:hypothetical protein